MSHHQSADESKTPETDFWPEGWRPLPEGLTEKARSFSGGDVSYNQFLSHFDADDLSQAFLCLFTVSRDSVYNMLATTKGQHFDFAQDVLKGLSESEFKDFIEAALADTTNGDVRRPIELAEVISYGASAIDPCAKEKIFSSLSAERVSQLCIHMVRDCLDIPSYNRHTLDALRRQLSDLMRDTSAETRADAISRIDDPEILRFIKSCCQEFIYDVRKLDSVTHTIQGRLCSAIQFSAHRLECNEAVEGFLSAHSADLLKGETLSPSRTIRYNSGLAGAFIETFAPGTGLAEAFAYLYHNHPGWAVSISLSLKGRHEHAAEMLSLCPRDAAFQLAKREIDDALHLSEEEKSRYWTISGGSAVKLLLREQNGSESPCCYFDQRLYACTDEKQYAAFLDLCHLCAVAEGSHLRLRIREALGRALKAIPGRNGVLWKNKFEDKLFSETLWEELIKAGFLETSGSTHSSARVTDMIDHEGERLSELVAAVPDVYSPERDTATTTALLREAKPLSSETARWLEAEGVSEAAEKNTEVFAVKAFTAPEIRRQIDAMRKGDSAAGAGFSENGSLDELVASFYDELGRGTCLYSESVKDRRYCFSSDAVDLFFDTFPDAEQGAAFQVILNMTPEIGIMISCSRKHHARTWAILSKLEPCRVARIIEDSMPPLSFWEEQGVSSLFPQFDNSTIARVLLVADNPEYFGQVLASIQNLSIAETEIASLFTHFYTVFTRLNGGRLYDQQKLQALMADPSVQDLVGIRVAKAIGLCSRDVQRWAKDLLLLEGEAREILESEERQARLEEAAPSLSAELARWRSFHPSSVPRVEISSGVYDALQGVHERLQNMPSAGARAADDFLARLQVYEENGRLDAFVDAYSIEPRDERYDEGLAAFRWYELEQAVSDFFRRYEYTDWGQALKESSEMLCWQEISGFLDRNFSSSLRFTKTGIPLSAAYLPDGFETAVGRMRVVDASDPKVFDEMLSSLKPWDIVALAEYPSHYSITGKCGGIITGIAVSDSSHAGHRAREIQVPHCYFPQAATALREFNDCWVKIEKSEDGCIIQRASLDEASANIGERLPGFLQDRGLDRREPVVKCSDTQLNRDETCGVKSRNLGELLELFPESTDADIFTMPFQYFFTFKYARYTGNRLSLNEVIADSTRKHALSTVEGRNLASRKIQAAIDAAPLPNWETDSVFWRNIQMRFGHASGSGSSHDEPEVVTEDFMMRVSMNLEDREGLSAAGAYLSLPVLRGETREAVEDKAKRLFKSGFSPEALLLREEAGVNHVGSGVAILCDPMPDFGRHVVLSANIIADTSGLKGAFCVGHGNYLMAEGESPAFTIDCGSDLSRAVVVNPASLPQTSKDIPQKNPDSPYLRVPLNTEESELLQKLKRGDPLVLRASFERISREARHLVDTTGKPWELELTLEQTETSEDGAWKLRYHQKRPPR